MIVPSFWEKGWETVCDMIQTLRSEDSGKTRDANASKAQLLFGLDHYTCALALWWSCSLRITFGACYTIHYWQSRISLRIWTGVLMGRIGYETTNAPLHAII